MSAKDGFAEIFSRMVEADGIILGSPIYSADVSAKMKAFLERGGVVVADVGVWAGDGRGETSAPRMPAGEPEICVVFPGISPAMK